MLLKSAIESVIRIFPALKAYYLEQPKCPNIIQKFFEDPLAEVYRYFVYAQAETFYNSIVLWENNKNSVIGTKKILDDLKATLKNRAENNFVPFMVRNILSDVDSNNPGVKNKFLKDSQLFYDTAFEYMDEWTANFEIFEVFEFVTLEKPMNYDGLEEPVKLIKEKFDVNIDENKLFDEVYRLNKYCDKDTTKFWSTEKIDIEKRWLEIFDHFEKIGYPMQNLYFLVDFILSLPGTNSVVERLFSLIFNMWTDEKSQLSMDTLTGMITIKFNLDYTCQEFHEILKENKKILEKIQ